MSILSTVIREKLNRGDGMVISPRGQPDFKMHKGELGALRKLKAKVGAAENQGGLTDTMEDRATIALNLAQLLTSIEAAGVDEEVALIYVDFVRGDPTRFHYATVYAFKGSLAETRGQTVLKLMVLGKLVKNVFGGGYRWEGPGQKVLARIDSKREMVRAMTEAQNARIRENDLAEMAQARAEGNL